MNPSAAIPVLAGVVSAFGIWALNWAAQGASRSAQEESLKRKLRKVFCVASAACFILGMFMMGLFGFFHLALYNFSFGLALIIAGMGFLVESWVLGGQEMIHRAEDPGLSVAE